jgi:alkylation response protein AidB-like acyl-CoA dehydrogenase
VDWASAAGYVDKVYQKRDYETLNLPTIQQVFTNIYLGIAQGALDTAAAYTRAKTRPWPYGGDNKEKATDEWYILETYGSLQSKLWAAEELANSAGAEISALLHAPREALTPQARGHVAVRIAAAKQVAIDTGLEIGSRIFEVTGARATSNDVGLDIFWRNIRTHSLHDPIAYKRREVGAYALLGEIPEPTWYT